MWFYVNSFRICSLSTVPSFVACTELYLNTCFLCCQGGSPRHIPTSAELDRKLAETDAYLQMLIEQVKVHSRHTFSLVCLQVKVPGWNFVSSTFQMSNLMSQIYINQVSQICMNWQICTYSVFFPFYVGAGKDQTQGLVTYTHDVKSAAK